MFGDGDDLLKVPLSELGLSQRVSDALLSEGIETVGRLTETRPDELLEVWRIHEPELAEIRNKLALRGLNLREG
jgi:DNA-directed RNA polymerase alpha subunit